MRIGVVAECADRLPVNREIDGSQGNDGCGIPTGVRFFWRDKKYLVSTLRLRQARHRRSRRVPSTDHVRAGRQRGPSRRNAPRGLGDQECEIGTCVGDPLVHVLVAAGESSQGGAGGSCRSEMSAPGCDRASVLISFVRVCPLVGRCGAARPAQTPSARVYGEESWDWGGAGSGESPRRRAAAVLACWVNRTQARRRGSWPGHGTGDVPGVGRSDSPCMREASPVAAER